MNGLHFLYGKNLKEPRLQANDAGKSTIFYALCWCLFGKTPDNLKNPDVRAWGAKELTKVTCKIKINDAICHVQRIINPNAFTINGKQVDNSEIEKAIGFNFELFTNTILLGQGRPLFFDLKPSDKLQLFSDVLNLERWEHRSKNAADELAELGQRQAYLEGQQNTLDAAEKEITESLKAAKTKAAEWDGERQDKLEEAQKTLRICTKQLDKAASEAAKYDLLYDGAETELRAIEANIEKTTKSWEAAREKYNEAQIKFGVNNAKFEELQQKLKELGDGKHCPLCDQPTTKSKLTTHRAEINRQISDLQIKIRKETSTKTSETYEASSAKLKTLRPQQTEFRLKAQQARDDYTRYNKLVQELTAKQKALKSSIEEREQQANPYREQVRSFRKRRDKIIAEAEDVTTRLRTLLRRFERTKFWVKGFKDVRLYIVNEFLQELEAATNVTLIQLGLENWSAHYAVEKQTKAGTVSRGLEVTILSPANKKQVRWECWGGGVGQRLRLAGTMALSEVLLGHANVSTNLELFDEPTRGLSAQGTQDLCECLAERAKQLNRSIWLIDHHAIESTAFSGAANVVKDAKGSRIVTG